MAKTPHGKDPLDFPLAGSSGDTKSDAAAAPAPAPEPETVVTPPAPPEPAQQPSPEPKTPEPPVEPKVEAKVEEPVVEAKVEEKHEHHKEVHTHPKRPTCARCGSQAVGIAGGMRRCNQCGHSWS